MTNMTPKQLSEKIAKIHYSPSRALTSVEINRKPMRNGDVRLELVIGFISLNTMEGQFNTHKIGDFTSEGANSKRHRLAHQLDTPLEVGFTSN